MIRVLAFIVAKPGLRERLLEIFKANVPAVLKEEGCLEYSPTIDVAQMGSFQAMTGADTFVVIETWASEAALKAHSTAPHMIAYGERAKDMIASRAIHVLRSA